MIYHAGTGRTTFLAMVKITTLFMGAFFCFVVAPSYVKAEKPEWETAGGMSYLPSPNHSHSSYPTSLLFTCALAIPLSE